MKHWRPRPLSASPPTGSPLALKGRVAGIIQLTSGLGEQSLDVLLHFDKADMPNLMERLVRYNGSADRTYVVEWHP